VKRIPALALLILSCAVVLAFGEDSRDELYEELSTSLAQAEALVAGMSLQDEAALTVEQLEALRYLNRQIRGSLYSDLIDRSDLLLLLAREQMLLRRDPQELQARLEGMLRDSRQDARNLERDSARDKVLRASFNTTLVSFAAAFAFWGLGELQDRRYFESTTIEGATLHRRLFQIFSIGSLVGATVGVIGAGVTVTLYAGAR
jgi:hypothetical protein